MIRKFKICAKILFKFFVEIVPCIDIRSEMDFNKSLLSNNSSFFLFVSNDPRLGFLSKERFEIGSYTLIFNIGEYKISIKKEFKN